jgi:hypothetical protein
MTPRCLLFLIAAVATAQKPLTFSDSSAPLNGPWMFFPGDNPGWAQPALDDSQWTSMDLTVNGGKSALAGIDDFLPGWTGRGFPSLTGYAWYRLSVRPKDPKQDLWLLMPDAVDDGYEVYANGQLVGSFGDIRPGRIALFNTRSMLFHLPPAGADGMLHLAIRMYMAPMTALTDPDAGGLHAPPVMGLRADLQTMFAEKQDVSLRGQLSGPIVALPEFLFGCLALALFLGSRHRKVYLWLGLCGLVTAYNNVFGMVSALTFQAALDSSFTQNNITFILTRMLWLFFWVWWFGLEKRRYLWVSGIAVCAANLVCLEMMLLPAAQAVIPQLNLVTVAARVLLAALLIATAAMGIRKNREGWLTLPALLAMGVGLFTNELTLLHMPIVYFPFGIQVWLSQLSSLACFTLSGALLIRRFIRELKAHTQLQNEVHSAQQVQQVLVPNELEPLENFAVEAVYVPASEVGGDFFQVIPCSNGSLLAVIGDVSGKGIPAAMVVALIVGTLRTAVEFTTLGMCLTHVATSACGSGFLSLPWFRATISS